MQRHFLVLAVFVFVVSSPVQSWSQDATAQMDAAAWNQRAQQARAETRALVAKREDAVANNLPTSPTMEAMMWTRATQQMAVDMTKEQIAYHDQATKIAEEKSKDQARSAEERAFWRAQTKLDRELVKTERRTLGRLQNTKSALGGAEDAWKAQEGFARSVGRALMESLDSDKPGQSTPQEPSSGGQAPPGGPTTPTAPAVPGASAPVEQPTVNNPGAGSAEPNIAVATELPEAPPAEAEPPEAPPEETDGEGEVADAEARQDALLLLAIIALAQAEKDKDDAHHRLSLRGQQEAARANAGNNTGSEGDWTGESSYAADSEQPSGSSGPADVNTEAFRAGQEQQEARENAASQTVEPDRQEGQRLANALQQQRAAQQAAQQTSNYSSQGASNNQSDSRYSDNNNQRRQGIAQRGNRQQGGRQRNGQAAGAAAGAALRFLQQYGGGSH